MSSNTFEGSSEYDDWIENTGGRDESYDYYYERWQERTDREHFSQQDD